MNFRKILVPIDFSPCSWAALDCAATLAAGWGASVDLLHVLAPPTPFADVDQAMFGAEQGALVDFAQARSKDVMREYLAVLERRSICAEGHLDVGDPQCSIVRHAADGRYDLVVLGTHGHTGVPRDARWGTVEKVVRRARCAVLTVRAPETRAVRPWAEAG